MTENGPGTLYLCATPIGNLEDITLRVLSVLKSVDYLAAEDTRRTIKLLNHYEIKVPLISYHEHNRRQKGPQLIELLQQGKNIALVSDAGTPGISDPGYDLVCLAIEHGINVIPLPGPTAFVAALIASGLPTDRFVFEGFLPKARGERLKVVAGLRGETRTLVFYESPHRLLATLAELATALGDRPAAAAREITKKFEEISRGTISELQAKFGAAAPRGEFTLIVGGSAAVTADVAPVGPEAGLTPAERVAQLMATGIDKKTAIKQVAVERGLPKREVYAAVLDLVRDRSIEEGEEGEERDD